MELIKLEGYNRIYCVDCLPKEFSSAVTEGWADSPPYQRYQKKLMSDLAVLDDFGANAIKLASFERLEDSKFKMCSIRHPETKKNVRVIYVIEGQSAVLLTAFLEKNKSDYRIGLERAENRYELLLK